MIRMISPSLLALFLFAIPVAMCAQVPSDPALLPKYEEAHKLFSQASKLDEERTSESRRSAIKLYSAAAVIFRETASKEDESDTLGIIGATYSSLYETEKALEYYGRAVALAQDAGYRTGESAWLVSAGVVYDWLGQKQKALEYYGQGLTIRRSLGDKKGEATALHLIGYVYDSLGEKQKALEHYLAALPLWRVFGDKVGEANTLNNIGNVHRWLGDLQKSLEYHERALLLRRAAGDKNGEAATLHNIAFVYAALAEKQKALEYYAQANALWKAVGDKRGESYTLTGTGEVYFELGEKQKALKLYEEALPLRRLVGDKRGEAYTLTDIGLVYDSLGDKQKALEHYSKALPIWRSVGDKSGEAETLKNAMFTWAAQNAPDLAIVFGKHSINIYQQLRRNIQGLDAEMQKKYLKSVESTYRKLANILIANGRIAEAEQVLGMLKEEEFLSYLRRDDKVAADLKGRISLSVKEREAFDEYEKLADTITRTAEDFGAIEKKKNALPLGQSLSDEDQKLYDTLKAKNDAAVTVFGKYLDDLKVKFGRNDVRVASVESDTQGILKRLGEPRTVIISTIVGEERLNLIVTTSDIQKAHTVDIKAADLNQLVADFRESIKNPSVDPRPAGRKLYDTLFPAGLQRDLKNVGTDRIIWSLDGALRYVPMSALWDGTTYLAERYTSAVLTLASRDKLTASSSTDKKPWRAFGVGVSKPFENFNALPAVPGELCSVVNDPKKRAFCKSLGYESRGVVEGLMLADDEFTLAGFRNNLGKTQVVHIASHFSLNAGNEIDSFLLLGGGTERRFSLDDLRKTRLDNVDLLTLSACNTAMTSGANSSGVEVEGFGALAQKQGARSVLATLWAVADDSTSLFMAEFYRIKKANSSVNKAEAIRLAQKAMIEGRIKSSGAGGGCRGDAFVSGPKEVEFKCDPNAPYSHPYFWSPFVLIGNWR